VKSPTYVTFDCYDTLVEFDIDTATRRILGARADQIDLDAFLAEFETLRYRTTTFEPYRPYRDVLRNTLAQMMERYGLHYTADDGDALLAAVRTWGPYPEVPAALERLRTRCKLVIITNSDDDIIASNVRNIGVPNTTSCPGTIWAGIGCGSIVTGRREIQPMARITNYRILRVYRGC
jgi:2-haloacid dehalogenase